MNLDYFSALILGIIEGITEFLPISSTGHLILASKLLSINQNEFTKSFEIVIQSGAILSIIVLYFRKIISNPKMILYMIIGFIPSGIFGLLFYKFIKQYLFSPFVVSLMLIVWGIIFIFVELLLKGRYFKSQIDTKTALLIGFFQCFALIPGTSRSGATIIGGMLLGLSRKDATEFSFLLSVPTIIIASVYDLIKEKSTIFNSDIYVLLIGFITSFIFAYISVKWLINFVSKHSLVIFGIYRIIIGIVFIYL
ncbi:MAG: undecaprenyl-diphosphate phosphatase [candidate division WOR-3 bacterium]